MFKSLMLTVATTAIFVPTATNACVPPMVEFAFASAQLSPAGRNEVTLVLERARAVPDARVKLTATTDGSRSNLRMSRRRVDVIKAVLARGGVPVRRIDVEYISAVSDSSARLVLMEVVSAPTCGG